MDGIYQVQAVCWQETGVTSARVLSTLGVMRIRLRVAHGESGTTEDDDATSEGVFEWDPRLLRVQGRMANKTTCGSISGDEFTTGTSAPVSAEPEVLEYQPQQRGLATPIRRAWLRFQFK